jgi:hypothetical protein
MIVASAVNGPCSCSMSLSSQPSSLGTGRSRTGAHVGEHRQAARQRRWTSRLRLVMRSSQDQLHSLPVRPRCENDTSAMHHMRPCRQPRTAHQQPGATFATRRSGVSSLLSSTRTAFIRECHFMLGRSARDQEKRGFAATFGSGSTRFVMSGIMWVTSSSLDRTIGSWQRADRPHRSCYRGRSRCSRRAGSVRRLVSVDRWLW